MTHTVIPDNELIELVEKRVNDNGQIYIGRQYRNKIVRAYIVKVDGSE
ncbi:MAG: hypothetical protein MIO93_01225 [ANME-2 cluster archaeon]|nr:hypothetical protein [ANME-2 cluster archaeon]